MEKGLGCIIAAESIYEMYHKSGKPERWHIQLYGAIPMGIAGIYRQWYATVRSTCLGNIGVDGHHFRCLVSDYPLIRVERRPMRCR
jgi:putative SOS response-associated peptidase YedK